MKLEKDTNNNLDKITINIEKQCKYNNTEENIDLSDNKIDLSKIDSERIKEAENQVEDSIQNTVNNITESMQHSADKATEKMNEFINNISDCDIAPDKLQVEPNYTIILNIIIPGIAQILNGQVEKGIILLFGTLAVNLLIGLCSCGIGMIISYPLCIAFICYDGYKCANKLKHKQRLKKFEFGV